MSAAKKTVNRKAARRAVRPVFATVMRLVNPDTGELIGAFVPSHPSDRRAVRERKYSVGTEVRLDIKQSRNVKFHRLMHAIGQLLVDHASGFDHLDAHGAIKRVQREAGVCCEEMVVDMGTLRLGDMEIPIGERPVRVPESMAFDDMSQERAEELFKGVTDWIAANLWPDMPAHAVEEMALMIQGEH